VSTITVPVVITYMPSRSYSQLQATHNKVYSAEYSGCEKGFGYGRQ